MLYFAQALGDAGNGDAGFGDPTRTTIFDYWGVDTIQRWSNGGKYDGGQLTNEEKSLRQYYVTLLSFSANNKALTGQYFDLNSHNITYTETYPSTVFSFARWQDNEKLVVLSNFSATENHTIALSIPEQLINKWGMADGTYLLTDAMTNKEYQLIIKQGQGKINASLNALESLVLQIN